MKLVMNYRAAMKLIKAERARQIEKEGYDAVHDATHGHGAIVRAAECYEKCADLFDDGYVSVRPPNAWPWEKEMWKPKLPDRDLVRAGALYLAEMDRVKALGALQGQINLHLWAAQRCARKLAALKR